MRKSCKSLLSLSAMALMLAMAVSPSFATTASGDPTGTGVSANIPVNATVAKYAQIAFDACNFGAGLGAPASSSTCTTAPQVNSNAAVNVTFTPSRLSNGAGAYLITNFSFQQGAGAAVPNVSGDPTATVHSAAFAQAAAPLNTPTVYNVSGTATNDGTSTLAGTYTGQIAVTIAAQ